MAQWEIALLIDRALGSSLPMLYRDHVAITIPFNDPAYSGMFR